MSDVNIDPFREHDRTESHPKDTGETIPFTLGDVVGESTCELD